MININAKKLSFLAVVIQQTSLVLVIRYSKTRVVIIPYLTSVVVFSAELFKLVLNGILEIITSRHSRVIKDESSSSDSKNYSVPDSVTVTTDELSDAEENKDAPSTLNEKKSDNDNNFASIILGLIDVGNQESLKLVVPAILYVIQNNLLFYALSNLSVPTYQITNQGKLLTTAIISRIILKKEMSNIQYFAIVLLGLGVAVVHISEYLANLNLDSKQSGEVKQQNGNQWLGLLAVFVSCITSGFCGVYFELILKTTEQSVYCRNFHLAFYSLVLASFYIFYSDSDKIRESGIFQGFDEMVLVIVVMQSMTGFVVSMMFKYSTAVLKGFATSIAVVVATIASFFLFDTSLNANFFGGATLVILAVKLFSTKNDAFLSKAIKNNKKRSFKEVAPLTCIFGLIVFGLSYNYINLGFPGAYADDITGNAPVVSWTPQTTTTIDLFPACTPTDYHRDRPVGISEEKFEKVLTGQEIVNYIVTELHKVGVPVALLFGTALHEYRNGTGNCVHPWAKEDDFDIGVLQEHFHYVVLLIGKIEIKFGWKVEYGILPRWENTFLYFHPAGQDLKEGFQIDVYAIAIDRPRKGLVSFYWDKVRVGMDGMFPLVKHKPLVITSNKTMVNGDDTPFFYMPFNAPCYLSNLYGEDFMTPRKVKLGEVTNAQTAKDDFVDKWGHPDCHRELSEKETIELQRQRSFVKKTYEMQPAADLIWSCSWRQKKYRGMIAKILTWRC